MPALPMGDGQFLALPSGPTGLRNELFPGRANARRIYTVRRSVLSVAVGVLALTAAGPGFSQINTSGIPPIQRGNFNLAEAYPATSGSYTGATPVQIAPNGCWDPSAVGFTDVNPIVQAPTVDNRCAASIALQPTLFNAIPALGRTGFAVAGILCLPTSGSTTNPQLNVNAFAVRQPGDDPNSPCFVQMVRLIKTIPGSIKCPDVYGAPVLDANGNPTGAPSRTYAQFGATPSGIRTWWALNYTMPGTKFTLQLTVVCRKLVNGIGSPSIHVDQYTWTVVANANTLPVVINNLHTTTVGTMEIPCIVSEQAYCDLMAGSGLISLADASGSLEDRFTAIQTFEGLLQQYCTFVDFVDPTLLFPGPIDPTTQLPTYQPPSDLGSIPGGAGSVGIIDSLEHPCCCKMLVDVEAIAQAWGVAQ